MAYGVVHTSNLLGCDCYSFINEDVDIENGSLVTKGDLLDGERDIYKCAAPATATLGTAPVYLVANPAWSYDDCSITNQNEDAFINKAGVPFRVYELKPTKRFRVSVGMLTGTVKKGSYVGLANASYKGAVTDAAPTGSAFVGKIIAIDDIGFDYCVGSAGTTSGSGDNATGGVIANTQKFALIEVVSNSPVVTSGD